MPHPLTDHLRLVASPMKLSATPVQYRLPPPLLGEHTNQVLQELGWRTDEVEALRNLGVI